MEKYAYSKDVQVVLGSMVKVGAKRTHSNFKQNQVGSCRHDVPCRHYMTRCVHRQTAADLEPNASCSCEQAMLRLVS